jgi:excisionase family DNA binding protein
MRSRQDLKGRLSLEPNVTPVRAVKVPSESSDVSDRLLTDRDVCALTGFDRVTLYRLRNAGKIGFYKFGKVIRYSPDHIREFLQQYERQPKPRRNR